jgi:sugar phosphate isomerase/epimerase
VTRRDWIAGALSALAAGRLNAASHITKARITAITDELGYNQPDAMAAAKMFNLQWVDLRFVPGTPRSVASLSDPELRHVAAELATNKLKASVLHADAKNDIERAIHVATVVGAGGIRISSGKRVADASAALPDFAKSLSDFIPMAEAAKVRLLIATDATQNVGTSSEAKALLELLPSKAVGLDWVPAETLKLGETPWREGYAILPKARIFHVTAQPADFSDGASFLNWRAILEGLQRDNFTGEVGLETGSGGGAFQKADEPMRDLLHVVGQL